MLYGSGYTLFTSFTTNTHGHAHAEVTTRSLPEKKEKSGKTMFINEDSFAEWYYFPTLNKFGVGKWVGGVTFTWFYYLKMISWESFMRISWDR